MSASPPPSSSAPFAMSSGPASTAASSPPPTEDLPSRDEENDMGEYSAVADPAEDEQFRERFARLEHLLEKSFTYSNLLGAQMDKEKRTSALRAAMKVAPPLDTTARKRAPRKTQKRARVPDEPEDETTMSAPKTAKPASAIKNESETRPKFLQPSLVTGAKLKDYQLEGVEWMVSLDKNGVSGILADEMGLGKTLQAIAFNAHLRELGHFRPFLVVCPLSVVHNWIDEFHRFAPSIPVCMYHGTPAERAELRRTVMREPDDGSQALAGPGERVMVVKGPSQKGKSKNGKGNKANAPAAKSSKRRPVKRRKIDSDDDATTALDDDDDVRDDSDDDRIPAARDTTSTIFNAPLAPQTQETFPVVVTTYEIIIRDRSHLAKYNWGYILVDEGHRLKNLNCRLIQEIKKYPSAGRMILTGTPLHNNLSELWSLLNFILPDIFDDLDTFQEWFNLGTLQSRLSRTRSTQLISTLHGILKPFLLRRLKADVEGLLPPKKEYVIYAPLSVKQRNLYDEIVEGRIRRFLIGMGCGEGDGAAKVEIDMDAPRKLRGGKRKKYDVDGNDEEYFELMGNGQHRIKENVKGINNMRLQNTVMQLRKACLTSTSIHGKMMLLERLLDELFRRKHKVLLFSQFTTMLDIIEVRPHSCDTLRLPLERRNQMSTFQEAGDSPDAPVLFLLSTRAGGLGITLTAADTVIFYDQDWNPQMDIQAQDRAHRIGQKKPVLIFRLVTAHTIETKIMQRATEKRKLEALVIAKGKFKMPGQAGRTKADNITEMAAALLRLEGDHIEVVPETREGKKGVSDAVFTDRGSGWSSGMAVAKEGEEAVGAKKAAFAVYEAPVHTGNELVAKLMGEDVAG
ncbi:SNF2 family N-terminal domain-containing protein [Melanogaster broomeanus]|nr:SNF2 family N-terminal domain-containing protein [Melanogaster broomeanus]